VGRGGVVGHAGLVKGFMSMGGAMSFESYEQGDVTVVCLTDDMTDRVTLERTNFELHGIVEELDSPRLVMDLSGMTAVTSAVLGVIMGVNLKITRKKGQLHICGLTAQVSDVFRLVKLDKILDIHPSVAAAVSAANAR
jgi:anti-anti-sigma factor